MPDCRLAPDLDRRAQRFGCLYGLEGSSLGGTLIARHLRDHLGITESNGARYFAGYGGDAGAGQAIVKKLIERQRVIWIDAARVPARRSFSRCPRTSSPWSGLNADESEAAHARARYCAWRRNGPTSRRAINRWWQHAGMHIVAALSHRAAAFNLEGDRDEQ